MIAGRRIGADPICTIPSTRTAKASTPAWGTPAIFSPTPASSDCSTAMPITPCATVRIVAPASARKSALRCGTILASTLLTAATCFGPDGNRNPAISTEAMNLSVPVPALPAIARTGPASGFKCGAIWRTAPSRLTDAVSQMLYSGAPIIGQSRMPSGGGGMPTSPDVS